MNFHPLQTTGPEHSAYSTLSIYLSRHEYKRGAHKGAAPADPARRGKAHFRVERRPGALVVRLHRTDIVTVRESEPDTVILNTDGWHTSPTTREALWVLGARGGPLYGRPWLVLGTPHMPAAQRASCSATSLVLPSETTAYHDGVKLVYNPALNTWQHHPDTPPRPLRKLVADRPARRAILALPEVREFLAALPVLLASATPQVSLAPALPTGRLLLADIHDRDTWPTLLAALRRRTSDPATAVALVKSALVSALTVEVDA